MDYMGCECINIGNVGYLSSGNVGISLVSSISVAEMLSSKCSLIFVLVTPSHIVESMSDNMNSIITVSDFFAASIAGICGVSHIFWTLNLYKKLSEKFCNDSIKIC